MDIFKYLVRYAIIPSSSEPMIDYSQLITSKEGVRPSISGTLLIVKWEGLTFPSSLENIQEIQGPYTHEEILQIVQGPEWNEPEI
jgi:hypothetical protein